MNSEHTCYKIYISISFLFLTQTATAKLTNPKRYRHTQVHHQSTHQRMGRMICTCNPQVVNVMN